MSNLLGPGKKPDPLDGLRKRKIKLDIDLQNSELFKLNKSLNLEGTKWDARSMLNERPYKYLQLINQRLFSDIPTVNIEIEDPFNRPPGKINPSFCFYHLKNAWNNYYISNRLNLRHKEIVAIKPNDLYLERDSNNSYIKSRIWIYLDVQTGKGELMFWDKHHDAWWIPPKFGYCKSNAGCDFLNTDLPFSCQRTL